MIQFDKKIPKKEHGFWGLKVNGGAVSEVIWAEKKPTLELFKSVRPKIFEENPFPGIDSLEVVRVQISEVGPSELLANSWFDE